MIVAIEKKRRLLPVCCVFKLKALTLTPGSDKFKEVITCPQIYRIVSNAHIIPFKN